MVNTAAFSGLTGISYDDMRDELLWRIVARSAAAGCKA
jgi:hypothetical protein